MRGRFVVDTGDRSALTLFGPFWRAHQLDDTLGPGLEALTGYGVGGPIKGIVVRVPAFGFGKANAKGIVARLSLQNPAASPIRRSPAASAPACSKHFRTIVDYPHNRFLLVPLKAEPDRFDRAGLVARAARGAVRGVRRDRRRAGRRRGAAQGRHRHRDRPQQGGNARPVRDPREAARSRLQRAGAGRLSARRKGGGRRRCACAICCREGEDDRRGGRLLAVLRGGREAHRKRALWAAGHRHRRGCRVEGAGGAGEGGTAARQSDPGRGAFPDPARSAA
ncbi:MAG: hypothetical protein WDM81_11810 [Rhizomicrobium sp.]